MIIFIVLGLALAVGVYLLWTSDGFDWKETAGASLAGLSALLVTTLLIILLWIVTMF